MDGSLTNNKFLQADSLCVPDSPPQLPQSAPELQPVPEPQPVSEPETLPEPEVVSVPKLVGQPQNEVLQ